MALADNMPNDRPGDMVRRIADLERALRELRAARNLDQASITPEPGMGIRTGDFDGTDFAHPGTVGNYFGGDGLVANSLYLRPGSISNDELTNPVLPVAANNTGSGFAVTTAFVERAFAVLTVPAGFTQLSIMASGWVFAYNPNTSGGVDGTGTDALWCFVRVGGPSDTDSQTHGQGISGSGGFTTATAGIATVKSGLTPGSTVRLGVYAGSSIAGFAADAGNNATLSALLTWLR